MVPSPSIAVVVVIGVVVWFGLVSFGARGSEGVSRAFAPSDLQHFPDLQPSCLFQTLSS
jgi:hypothetical protein